MLHTVNNPLPHPSYIVSMLHTVNNPLPHPFYTISMLHTVNDSLPHPSYTISMLHTVNDSPNKVPLNLDNESIFEITILFVLKLSHSVSIPPVIL